MVDIKLIVHIDKNFGIGKNNGLLFRNKADMQFFKEKTTGSTVIMGRRTLESLPGGKPLKNRRCIILSSSLSSIDGAEVYSTVAQVLAAVSKCDTEVYVIGGASVYEQLLDYCDGAYVTKTDADGGADCFFPNLDEMMNWSVREKSETMHDGEGREFKFVTYVNSDVRSL